MFLRETFLLVESETRGGERLFPHATCIDPVPSRKTVVSIPRRGGGRGGRSHGRGGPPFRDHERNPRLVSNSSHTTLAASVCCLPPAPGQPAIASLLPSPALHPPPLPTIARHRCTYGWRLLPWRSALNQILFLVGLLPTMLPQS